MTTQKTEPVAAAAPAKKNTPRKPKSVITHTNNDASEAMNLRRAARRKIHANKGA